MERTVKSFRYGFTGVALVVFLIGAVVAARHARPKVQTTLRESPRSKGPLNAPIQVIEYSDFQCPACRAAQSELRVLLVEWGNKIRLLYEHFPLEAHRWSLLAHQSAECAARQGHFWGYHDRLYEQQATWSVSVEPPIETFARYAQDEGLDLNRFGNCLVDPQVRSSILESRSTGGGLGVVSTPTFFVNGKLAAGVKALKDEVDKLEKR